MYGGWVGSGEVAWSRWHAGHWRGALMQMDDDGYRDTVEVAAYEERDNSALVLVVTHGCMEPAWRARRVWLWGDELAVYTMCTFFAAMARPSEITF